MRPINKSSVVVIKITTGAAGASPFKAVGGGYEARAARCRAPPRAMRRVSLDRAHRPVERLRLPTTAGPAGMMKLGEALRKKGAVTDVTKLSNKVTHIIVGPAGQTSTRSVLTLRALRST